MSKKFINFFKGWLKKTDRHFGRWFTILFFSFVIIVAFRQWFHLFYYPRYTIAVPYDESRNAYYIKQIWFKYKVKDRIYIRRKNFLGVQIGKRYYLKFSFKSPGINDLLQDKPVPDSIKAAPPEGWAKIPGQNW